MNKSVKEEYKNIDGLWYGYAFDSDGFSITSTEGFRNKEDCEDSLFGFLLSYGYDV